MRTVEEVNKEIIDCTISIQAHFPEISKYIAEMPIARTTLNGKDAQLVQLEAYLRSLKTLITKYALNHQLGDVE
ncbi:MAG: hypothetical protein RLZZ543_817 [Bacteroidota bacterium]|jgi:hypothetical protein